MITLIFYFLLSYIRFPLYKYYTLIPDNKTIKRTDEINYYFKKYKIFLFQKNKYEIKGKKKHRHMNIQRI